ncbi:MAG TPA: radical SAM protein [Actinobacteria bacterium]|nr:radical SAM protein [Actinomycetota bacterium]
MFQPSYIKLYEQGEFARRVKLACEKLRKCSICPRGCGVDRLAGERGFCRVGKLPMVSSCHPHFGEERPLVGTDGSGTIFLTRCNLGCLFCQNYTISHLGDGREVSLEELAQMMLHLQRLGCHNINFVTPTHFVPQILGALSQAIEGGLNVPLVYNTGGYDALETLRLLDGVFDIYMPDFKYADGDVAQKLARAKDYPQMAKAAIKEMYRQVGDLVLDERGIALRGLLVRHLVLPGGLAGTREVMRFLAKEISPDTYVNVMDQYYPCYKAFENPPLDRRITPAEFEEAVRMAREEGLWRLDGLL